MLIISKLQKTRSSLPKLQYKNIYTASKNFENGYILTLLDTFSIFFVNVE